jgi:TolB-like protein/DNA-binding winged helix-turn-helix (wHTH) protein
MSSKLLQGFRLGPWKVEPLRGVVSGPNGETHHLEPKVMDVFVCLAEHANELVTRNQLLDVAWSGNTAFEEQLTRAIGALRRALQDDRDDPKYIETVPKRGYRLIGQIRLPNGTRLEKKQARSQSIVQGNQYRIAFVIVTVLVLALVYFAYDEFVAERMQEEAPGITSTQVEDINEIDRWEMSVAVLPFVNMSDDPGNEYFSDGLSEEILTLLARIPGLKVIGRTSSFAFKGKNEDLRVIGQTLGVKTVLEGSVRKSGDRVRITAQLVDVSDGRHIWSESYDRTMTDIFAIQDDVAAAIFDALKLHVGDNPTRGRPTENTEAYALFLKARASYNVFSLGHAEAFLLQAIEIDPKFAEAYELLAATYWRRTGDTVKAAKGQKLTGEAAAKALAIDPDLVFAQALYQAGNIETWSYLGEIEAFERAAREQPGNPAVPSTLVYDLLEAGYLQKALRVAERFVELDPLSGVANYYLFEALYAVGRTSEALVAADLALQLGSDNLKWTIGAVNLVDKQDDIAIAHFEAWLLQHDHPDSTWVRELVTGARDPATGQAYLDRRIPQIVAAMPKKQAYYWQLELTLWYLYLGFLDRYFELILAIEPTDGMRSDADSLVFYGTIWRRLGFTAHPKYLEVAESLGKIDVWEQRGPPDFCEKVDGQWVCE